MADPILTLEFLPGALFRRVIDAEEAFLKVATGVTEEVASKPTDLQWRLAHTSSNGVVRLQITPDPIRDVSADIPLRVVDAVVDGVAQLEQSSNRPAHFSDDVLENIDRLIGLRDDVGGLSIRNGERGTLIGNQIALNVGHILAPAYDEYGSVEGTLERLSVRSASRYFNVYDFITGRGVRCDFAHRIPLDQVKLGLERRVAVYGTLHVRRDGGVARVTAEELHIFPEQADLPTIKEARGILG